MNFSSSDWHTRTLNMPHSLTHDLLVIIGILTIVFLLVFLFGHFIFRLSQIYRTREPHFRKYPSYQQLIKSNVHLCQCLSNLQCVTMNCQISNRCENYEQINERNKSNSIARVCLPRHSCCMAAVHSLSKT